MNTTLYPLLTEPTYRTTIWGGTALEKVRGSEAHHTGASWEISIRSDCDSPVAAGNLAGKTLSELIAVDREGMLGASTQDNLMRVGILDAGADLSVQVHPDEAYAQAHEHDHGKTESWYVLASEPGATLVAGTDLATTDQLRRVCEDGTLEQHLAHHAVQPGEFVHVPFGEIHAIGAGVMVVEMSTNSDTTYRLYDYGRLDDSGKPRELHLKQCYEVSNPALISEPVHLPAHGSENRVQSLVQAERYELDLIDCASKIELTTDNLPAYLCFVEGSGSVTSAGGTVEVPYLRSVFVPAGVEHYSISGNCRVMRGRPRV